jgi:hypothetical protein
MLAATPVRNPIITEWETKRVKRPILSAPARIMSAPAMITSRKREAARSSGSMPANTDPAARAAAVVVVMTIILVLAANPPATGPAELA